MDPGISKYLALNSPESHYTGKLCFEYTQMRDSGNFLFAYLAHHLLFMCFIYQTLSKIKAWKPKDFELACTLLDEEIKRTFLASSSSWIFALVNERKIFNLLELIGLDKATINKCKEVVRIRNEHAHAAGNFLEEIIFEEHIEKYDELAKVISIQTKGFAVGALEEYIQRVKQDSVDITEGDIDFNLITYAGLSFRDLCFIQNECVRINSAPHQSISKVLVDTWEVGIENDK